MLGPSVKLALLRGLFPAIYVLGVVKGPPSYAARYQTREASYTATELPTYSLAKSTLQMYLQYSGTACKEACHPMLFCFFRPSFPLHTATAGRQLAQVHSGMACQHIGACSII